MATILLMLCLAMIATPSANAVPDGGETGSYDWIEKSLVYIETEAHGTVTYKDQAGQIQISAPFKAPMGFCSGFFVSRTGHIMTAGHCPDEDEGRLALMKQFAHDSMPEPDPSMPPFMQGEPTVEVLEAHGTVPGSAPMVKVSVTQMQCAEGAPLRGLDPVIAQVLDYKPLYKGDLAVLKIDVKMPTPPLTIASRSPRNGTDIIAIGYPGVVSQAMGDLGETPNQCMSAFTGKISQHQPPDLVGWPVLEHSAMTHGGMSGGPVVNTKGQVIGTVSWGLQDVGMMGPTRTGINYATDTPSVRSFLEQHGVPFVEPAQVITRPFPSTTVPNSTPTVDDNEPAREVAMTVDWTELGKVALGGFLLIGLPLIAALAVALIVHSRRQARRQHQPLPTAHHGKFDSPYPPYRH